MQKAIYLLTLVLAHSLLFAGQHLPDGIYLVDQLVTRTHAATKPNTALVTFNPNFVTEDPENYAPLLLKTAGFFSFAEAGQMLVQEQKNESSTLYLQLTEAGSKLLTDFTSINQTKKVAVVVNNEVLAVYKITKPVNGRLIEILKCARQAGRQVLKPVVAPGKI